jgi:(1->4)-alpha-D-glucan 1-alpha-D-glucosylmutase
MAKSLEDTLFYRDTRLVALNEVGGNPDGFGVSSAAFHAANQERRRLWPHAMIASQTHDSKRGEDFRARLFAISEAPDKWEEIVRAWFEAPVGDGGPDRNDRYFMLQTIVGAWPMEMLEDVDANGLEAYVTRLEVYFTKAFREAKRHSNWVDPNASYEEAAAGFLRAMLAADGAFAGAALPYIRRLARLGVLNSLSRLTLKCTIPGAPDTYQGSEFWDFSLVDPDNRRPVDFRAREEALGAAGSPAALMESWRDGRVKQALLARLLADRRAAPELYADGDYRPLYASGERAGHVIAFSRNTPGDSRVIVVGRLFGSFSVEESRGSGASVPIPSGQWRDLCTDRDWSLQSGTTELAALLFPLPVAVLRPLP